MEESKAYAESLPSFPSPPSSSSSDFEFIISLSPSSKLSSSLLCPADELFYKGQLLPLQHSPRLSMVRTLLSSSSTSSSRDSSSSHPSSSRDSSSNPNPNPKYRYFSSFTARFSSVFPLRKSKKDPSFAPNFASSAKEKLKKYAKKVRPLYQKISSLPHRPKKTFSFSIRRGAEPPSESARPDFSWKKSCAASCPSSTRSSPSHSGLLYFPNADSSMDELQTAIQAAIAHCKDTMMNPSAAGKTHLRAF